MRRQRGAGAVGLVLVVLAAHAGRAMAQGPAPAAAGVDLGRSYRFAERFVVAEYDGHIIGCAALYAFPDEKLGELAALAVQPDFRREGYGEALMREIETRARRLKLAELFVLTTKTAHWFLERGFRSASVADLPQQKQSLYNYQRKSQVYRKTL